MRGITLVMKQLRQPSSQEIEARHQQDCVLYLSSLMKQPADQLFDSHLKTSQFCLRATLIFNMKTHALFCTRYITIEVHQYVKVALHQIRSIMTWQSPMFFPCHLVDVQQLPVIDKLSRSRMVCSNQVNVKRTAINSGQKLVLILLN